MKQRANGQIEQGLPAHRRSRGLARQIRSEQRVAALFQSEQRAVVTIIDEPSYRIEIEVAAAVAREHLVHALVDLEILTQRVDKTRAGSVHPFQPPL